MRSQRGGSLLGFVFSRLDSTFLRDPVQETARRTWHRAGRAAVPAPCPHRPTPVPQDPNPPTAGRADRGGPGLGSGRRPLTGSPSGRHTSPTVQSPASNCVGPGARRLLSPRAHARTHARRRGRGCGGGGGPVPQRPGPADPASENKHRQLPAAPGVGRAPVAGGLQGQRGQGPSVPTPAARPPRPLPLPTCGSLRRARPPRGRRRPPERASRAHSTDPLGPPPLARVSGPPGPVPAPQLQPPPPRSASGPARSVCFCFVLPSNTGATAWRLLAERRTSRSQSWRPSCSRGGEAELGEVRRGNRGGAQGAPPSAHARWAWEPLGRQPGWGQVKRAGL